MKVMIISDSLSVGGGAERFSANLGRKLDEEGHQICHLALSDAKHLYQYKGDYYTFNHNNNSQGSIKTLWSMLRYSWRISRLCNNKSIDVVIAVGENPNFHAILSKYLFKNRANIIASQHISPHLHLDNSRVFNLIKFLYPHANNVVCVSRGIEHILNKDYRIQNTTVIYNSLDVEECLEKGEKEISSLYENIFKPDFFIFLNVGRLSLQKGQWHLIRSFKEVTKKKPHSKLIILGEGEFKESLKELIFKLELEDKVFLLGNQENIFPFIKKSNSFILSSLWEGFPMILLEVLPFNIPIISTDCLTGPRECLAPKLKLEENLKYPYQGDYGILTPPFLINGLLPSDKNMDLKLSDMNFESSLSPQEKLLATAMINIIDINNKFNGMDFLKTIKFKEIITKWQDIF